MKNKKILLIISLLLMPISVFAKSEYLPYIEDPLYIFIAIYFEANFSIFYLFLFASLSGMLFANNSKKALRTMFTIRAVVLLFCDFFISPGLAIMVDFYAMYVVAFLVIPICSKITKVPISDSCNPLIEHVVSDEDGSYTLTSEMIDENIKKVIPDKDDSYKPINLTLCLKCDAEVDSAYDHCPNCGNKLVKNAATNSTIPSKIISGIELRCAKCNAILKVTDKFCPNCGAPFSDDNVVVKENSNATIESPIITTQAPLKKKNH